jgi:DNA ligase-associated metallophosphoesterase
MIDHNPGPASHRHTPGWMYHVAPMHTLSPTIAIQWAGETFDLNCDMTAFWGRTSTLIVADTHFGKAAAFRQAGIPVPAGSTEHDLAVLTEAIHRHGAKRMIILGDFFHARSGRADSTMSLIERWLREYAELQFILVRGNHDHSAGDPPCEWNITCVDEPYVEGPLAFCHKPCEIADHHVMAGHVHPCAVLHDVDGSAERVPCFVFGPRSALMPAFGNFTGMHPIRPRSNDRVFAVGPDAVVEVKGVRA